MTKLGSAMGDSSESADGFDAAAGGIPTPRNQPRSPHCQILSVAGGAHEPRRATERDAIVAEVGPQGHLEPEANANPHVLRGIPEEAGRRPRGHREVHG